MNHSTGQYIPKPIDTSKATLPPDLEALSHEIAKNVHEVWAAGRMAEGWTYGPTRNDAEKKHPGLVPYEELTDTEKAYDYHTAFETLRLIRILGYEIIKE